MTWNPWKRVRQLETRLAVAETAVDRALIAKQVAVEAREAERTRYDELVERVLQMKQQGFVAPPRPQDQPEEERFDETIEIALAAVDEPDLRPQVRDWLAFGWDTDVIVERILQGGQIPT